MKRALKAEFRKLRYQRSTYGNLIGASALAAVSAIATIASTQLPHAAMMFDLTTEQTMQMIMASATGGYLFAIIIGIVMSTSEHRYSTAVATYLAQPNRRIVMVAKMITAAVAGFTVQLVSTLFGMAAAYIYVQRYVHAALPLDIYARVLAGSLLVGVVLGVVGVGLGTLIRSQIIAVIGAMLWLNVIESLLMLFADWIGKWTITAAISSILDVAMKYEQDGATFDMSKVLGPWQSALLLVGYGIAFGLAAMFTSMRRDVD